jgi:hypothetical protein
MLKIQQSPKDRFTGSPLRGMLHYMESPDPSSDYPAKEENILKQPRSHARKAGSTAINISMSAETLRAIEAAARATKRNRSNWIVYALEKFLEEHPEEHTPALPKRYKTHYPIQFL